MKGRKFKVEGRIVKYEDRENQTDDSSCNQGLTENSGKLDGIRLGAAFHEGSIVVAK